MKRVLIVAEKQKAAERIAKILSNGNFKAVKRGRIKIYEFSRDGKYFRCFGVRGHIFTTEFSKEIHEMGWRKVDPLFLLTDAPLTKILRKEARGLIDVLRDELKKCNVLIVATDFDREGENIGYQVAQLVGRKVNKRLLVKRAVFSSLNRNAIVKAFKENNLTDLDWNKVLASEVRQEIDLRMGVAFTRTATMAIQDRLGRPDFPLISIGPCQTPTLALIIEHYYKHLESVERAEKEKKFIIRLVGEAKGQKFLFIIKRDFSSKQEAKNFAKDFLGKKIRIIDVVEGEKTVKRPLPLNTPRLASLASKYLRLSSHETLMLAEKLYLDGLITYPRTETEKYVGGERSIARSLFEDLKKKKIIPRDVEYNGPLNGSRDDKAHPPIRPDKIIRLDKAKKRLGKGGGKAFKLYEFILKHFAANVSEDAIVKEIKYIGKVLDYVVEGKMEFLFKPGFLKFYHYDEKSKLPTYVGRKLSVGDELIVRDFEIMEKVPPIKPPISESSLIKLMDRLGIGTDATFAEHIKKLIDRRYVERRGGRLIPTPLGIALYEALKESAPEIIDPKIRARMESWFKEVELGKKDAKKVVEEAKKIFVDIFKKFKRHLNVFTKKAIVSIKSMGLEKFLGRRRSKKKLNRRHRF